MVCGLKVFSAFFSPVCSDREGRWEGAERERGGTTWQCRKCVEIVGSYMFNGRSSLCALQQCVACGQLGQERRREGGGEVHVKAGVLIIVLGKRSCKILIAF